MPLRQLISSDEAVKVSEQPTTPCSDCPFARASLAGWLGGSDTDEWIQAAHGEQDLTCHTLLDEDGEQVYCAGGAIYRANQCKLLQDPDAFRLEANHETVFSTPAQFVEHHTKGG